MPEATIPSSAAQTFRRVARNVASENRSMAERLMRAAQYLDGSGSVGAGGGGDTLDLSQLGAGPSGGGPDGGGTGSPVSQGAGNGLNPKIESFVSSQQQGTEHTATITWITPEDITQEQLMNDFMNYIRSKGWKPIKFGWQSRESKG